MKRWPLLIGLALTLAACSSGSKPAANPTASDTSPKIPDLEAHFNHKMAQPSASLGAKFARGGYFPQKARPGLFKEDPALLVYTWKKDAVLLVFQGPKDPAFSFSTVSGRSGAKLSTGPNGEQVAVIPAAGQTPIQGFIDFGDWLVEVDVGVQAGGPGSNLSFPDAEKFVTSMTLR